MNVRIKIMIRDNRLTHQFATNFTEMGVANFGNIMASVS